jgi:hypothetical protein
MTRPSIVAASLVSLLAGGCAAHTAKTPAAIATPQGPVIVRLVGRHQTVTVTSSGNGPLYSVQNDKGKLVVANATLEELRAEHPDMYQLVEPTLAVDASLEGRTALPAKSRIMLDSRE